MTQAQLNNWLTTFNLKFSWQQQLPATIAATLALATLNAKVEDEYYLAKQQIKINNLPKLNQQLLLTGKIKQTRSRNKSNYLTCQTTVETTADKLIDLSSTLIKKQEPNKTSNSTFSKPTQSWRTITNKQVYKFSQYSGDSNSIHLTEQPIVHGMLLLLLLEDYLATNQIQFNQGTITYLQPIRSGDQIKLATKNNTLSGIVNQQLCFKFNWRD